MSLIRQVALLTAGAQPWNYSVCTTQGNRFAYAATQAIYIYEFDDKFNEFVLMSIMAEHTKPISSIQWHPTNIDIIASSNTDNIVIIWNVSKRKSIAILETYRYTPTLLGWCNDKDMIAYIDGRGPLYTWNYTESESQPVPHKEGTLFSWTVTVMRWHPKQLNKVIFGHSNGSVSMISTGVKSLRHITIDVASNVDEENPIIALEWDPLSLDYLLVGHKLTGIRLVDTSKMTVATVFTMPSNATMAQTLGWLPEAPGMFVSGDSQTGILRLWNVSRSTSLECVKLKHIGFHVLVPMRSKFLTDGMGFAQKQLKSIASSSSMIESIIPTLIVSLFKDGGVGVYNLTHRKWEFLKEMGHIETIFDCKFKPSNPDLIATGSFDGSIKVWNINSMTPEYSSNGNESIIYAISWAPADLNCIAAATSKHGVVIWNLNKGIVIQKISDHGLEQCVYCVSWNQIDARRIASGAGDMSCMVHHADGSLIQKYMHPGMVFGCEWKTDDADTLATSCLDGIIRIFLITRSTTNPLKTLQGHTAKVFQVKWNPLRTEILCSSSDDNSIRVWDTTANGSCICVLHGHTSNVRGLAWNPEVPYLLFSGSWDKTIRAWDARDGACLETVFDHGADVYGLTMHYARPFLLVSSSRDSTVRVWSVQNLCPLLQLSMFVQRPWTEIVAFTDRGYSLGAPALLCGRKSLELRAISTKIDEKNFLLSVQLFAPFFSHTRGVVNLWDLVKVIQGKSLKHLSSQYTKGIMHSKHITKIKASEAQELEMTSTTRFGQGGGIGLPGREECLRSAADILLRVGHLKKYCDVLMQLGEWEQALAVAPGVSYEYWRDLASRRLEILMHENSEKSLVYGVAIGDLPKMLEFVLNRREMADAYILAAAGSDGNISKTLNNIPSDTSTFSLPIEDKRFIGEVTKAMAEWYFQNGSPVHAACCRLAIDDIENAISYLVRGQELELAVSVSLILNVNPDVGNVALQHLAKRCERLGQWELAIRLLQIFPGNYDTHVWYTCTRSAGSLAEMDALHKLANLPPRARCEPRAAEFLKSGNILQAIRYYLVSPEVDTGLRLGLDYIRAMFVQDDWKLEEVWNACQLLGSIRTEKLQDYCNSVQLGELLIFSAYIGSFMAIRRGYEPIITPMLTHASTVYKKYPNSNVPFSKKKMDLELEAWKYYESRKGPLKKSVSTTGLHPEGEDSCQHFGNGDTKCGQGEDPDPTITATLKSMLNRAGEDRTYTDSGITVVTGSRLPTHSDVHMCCLTGEIIQGQAYFLENGLSAMSINHALMWAKVNPFSPLGSGERLNPF